MFINEQQEGQLTTMRRTIILAALALATIAGASGSAAASSLSIAPAGAITATTVGRVTLVAPPINIIECAIQFTGSLAAGPVEKTPSTSIGAVTNLDIDDCNIDIGFTPLGIPWALEYVSTSGTLPNAVTGITVQVDRFQMRRDMPLVGTCLYEGLAAFEIPLSGSNPYTTGNVVSRRTTLARVSSVFCPASEYIEGSFAITPAPTVTRL